MKRADVAIIAAVLIIALAVFLITGLPVKDRASVAIYVGSELYERVSASDYGTVTVDQGDGRVNIVTIDEEGVRMESSTCKNQLCVKQGTLHPDDADELVLENWIICLPNGVSVELEAGE